MGEYVAGRGTTGMSIAGLVTGIIGTLGTGGNLLGNGMVFGNQSACMHDVQEAQYASALAAENAMLRAEKYADGVRDDAKQYGIEVYKELKEDITKLKDEMYNRWTKQEVINANLSNAITALDGQEKTTAGLVAEITKTAVRKSAICDFDGRSGCGGCSNNI